VASHFGGASAPSMARHRAYTTDSLTLLTGPILQTVPSHRSGSDCDGVDCLRP